jgi:alkylation response protein AidB-like acyl-CoA dehydrogenase
MGKTDRSKPAHLQQSMVLVPMDTPGITIVRPLTIMGYDDAPTGHPEIRLENVCAAPICGSQAATSLAMCGSVSIALQRSPYRSESTTNIARGGAGAGPCQQLAAWRRARVRDRAGALGTGAGTSLHACDRACGRGPFASHPQVTAICKARGLASHAETLQLTREFDGTWLQGTGSGGLWQDTCAAGLTCAADRVTAHPGSAAWP